MNRWITFALPLLVVCAGCTRKPTAAPPGPSGPVAQGPGTPASPEQTGIVAAGYTRDPNDPFQTDLYSEPSFAPKVPEYTVEPGFANVANWKQHASRFDSAQQDLLARNLFVVVPADRRQMAFIYEENTYTKKPGDQEIPSFVTTDLMLHTFHVFYDFSMRIIESGPLYDAATEMTRSLIEGSIRQYGDAGASELKQAASKNIAYLLVPARALRADLKGLAIPPEAQSMADAEWKLIQAHLDRADSPIFGYKVDYSQFVPRGHYTRSEKLKRFFVAFMWYGSVPILARDETGQVLPDQVRQAALLGELLTTPASVTDNKAPGILWRHVYEPFAFLVGVSDDMNPSRFKQAVDAVRGERPLEQVLADSAAVEQIADEAAKRNPTRIISDFRAQQVAVKLMGQRFTLDSYALQQLILPKVGAQEKPRRWFSGLDLMAVLGSDRALELQKQNGQAEFASYETQVQAMRDYVKKVTPDQWQENVYWGWLDVLRRQVADKGAGYPSVMRSAAWQDRQLNGGLGSWSELKHDTVLHAKQVVAAEAGEGGDWENAPPRGYVEPDIRVYHRLQFLNQQLMKGLNARGLLVRDIESKAGAFDDLLGKLVEISRKELADERLTNDEENALENIGQTLSYLDEYKLSEPREGWEELSTDADRDMALAADVETVEEDHKVLQANVGHANEIWAIFPAKGKLWIGRGAVFSYYEFQQPIADRLTDEAWQAMLAGPNRPQPPAWTRTFVSGKDVRIVDPKFKKGG